MISRNARHVLVVEETVVEYTRRLKDYYDLGLRCIRQSLARYLARKIGD